MAIERSYYLDATYELMTGNPPDPSLSRRDAMIAIMLKWDRQRIRTSEERGCAQMSLAAIGLDVYRSLQLPYTLDQVVERLRSVVSLATMTDIEYGDIFRVMNSILHPPPGIRRR